MRALLKGTAFGLLLLSACGNAQPKPNLISVLEHLAEAGNAEAMYHLGMAYHTGAGLPEDRAKALEYFRRSATAGDALASYKLGCFYDGQGGDLVDRDQDLALAHKLVAANAGYALAQQDVAKLYVDKGDIPSALGWLKKAADQGWPDALMAYASVHNGASGFVRDPVTTAAYFRLYLDKTDPDATQRQWLSDFESRMTPDDRQRAQDIVRSYRPAPTALTIKALSGQRAAVDLAARHH